MKNFIKNVVLGLLLVSLLGSFCSCKDSGISDGNGDTSNNTTETVGFDDKRTYQGLHDLTAPEVTGDDYVIKNGVFQYTLVVPKIELQTTSMKNAIDEFCVLTQKATGIKFIPQRIDTSIVDFDENDKYISFGDNSLLEKAGVTYDKSVLKQNGARILTVGKSIFILGGSDTGVLNAVYTFMQICYDYEFFSRNCLKINTGVRELKLRNFNVTDVPDIDWVDIDAGWYSSDFDAPTVADQYALGETVVDDLRLRKYRLRSVYSEKDFIHEIKGTDHLGNKAGYFHNTANYIEPDSPECESNWVANSGRQICYTAHGDTESLLRLQQFCANKIIDALIATPYAKNPEKNYVTLTEEDGGGNCGCDSCVAEAEKNGGSKSSSLVKFANAVIDLVYKWMNEIDENGDYIHAEYRRPTLKLVIFAYGEMKNAPAYYDETQGKYVAYSEEVTPNDKIIAWCCTGSSPWNWFESPYSENNAALKGLWVEAWGDIGEIWWWGHSGGDWGYFFYQDWVSGHNSDMFQWLASLDTVRAFFWMSYHSSGIAHYWEDVAAYVYTQLAWDSTQDSGVLIEKYFNAMYQDAAGTMLKLFNEQRTYYQFLNQRSLQETGKPMNLQYQYWSEKDYPYDVIKNFLDIYYQAIGDIALYETNNPELYTVLRDRIEVVGIHYYGMLFYIYGDTLTPPFTQEQRAKYKEEALEILKRYPNITGMKYEDFLKI